MIFQINEDPNLPAELRNHAVYPSQRASRRYIDLWKSTIQLKKCLRRHYCVPTPHNLTQGNGI
jgi:hypothetical protein